MLKKLRIGLILTTLSSMTIKSVWIGENSCKELDLTSNSLLKMEHGLLGRKLKKVKIRILTKEIVNLVQSSKSLMKIQNNLRNLSLTLKKNLEIQKMMIAKMSSVSKDFHGMNLNRRQNGKTKRNFVESKKKKEKEKETK